MSKRKSLGSSPFEIGSDTSGSLGFIPDLGMDNSEEIGEKATSPDTIPLKQEDEEMTHNKVLSEKKTVSYYLDTRLIDKVKSIANDKDLCYSAVVTQVLKRWLSEKKNPMKCTD